MKKFNYKKKRRICIISTNRADYSHLKKIILKIQSDKSLVSHLIVSGSHLSKKHGYSINEILKDKLKIFSKIDIGVDTNYTGSSVIKSLSSGLTEFQKKILKIKPDIILILGDRYELLPIAQISLFNNIPLAHIHGGETTSGVFDEQIRHSLSKLSDIHFVADKIFAKNLMMLGENKKNIFIVGSPGCENIKDEKFLNKANLEKLLSLKLLKKNLLVTLHPVANRKETLSMTNNLFKSLSKLKNTLIIFTGVNTDVNSDIIYKKIIKLSKNKNFKYFKHLGQNVYLSLIKKMDCIVGNSSSGFIEAPAMKVGVINIGNRQDGRPISSNILQTKPLEKSITNSINIIYTGKFKANLKQTKSFYFKKKTSNKIIKILKNINLKNIKRKKFINE